MTSIKTKDNLIKKRDQFQKEMNNLTSMFNAISEGIGKRLVAEFPGNRDLVIYNQIITSIIKKKPLEPISIFMVHIYGNDKYREAILNEDEKFFKSSRHENLTSSDEDKIKAMFQFQSCWDKTGDELKKIIKSSMKKLVEIAGDYILTKGEHADTTDMLKKN
jgi:hypothetical protein